MKSNNEDGLQGMKYLIFFMLGMIYTFMAVYIENIYLKIGLCALGLVIYIVMMYKFTMKKQIKEEVKDGVPEVQKQ